MLRLDLQHINLYAQCQGRAVPEDITSSMEQRNRSCRTFRIPYPAAVNGLKRLFQRLLDPLECSGRILAP